MAMNLNDLITYLTALRDDYGPYVKVISASDPEGNSYRHVDEVVEMFVDGRSLDPGEEIIQGDVTDHNQTVEAVVCIWPV